MPTPGGGAAAAVSAALGAASGAMASIYTTRKKDIDSGVAEEAEQLASRLTNVSMNCLAHADKDAEAYSRLQSTWKKDNGLSESELTDIKKHALDVPTELVRICHGECVAVMKFIPKCNPMIVSDAKVAIHLLAGAARAAYQTVLVNSPSKELQEELVVMLEELGEYEKFVLKSS